MYKNLDKRPGSPGVPVAVGMPVGGEQDGAVGSIPGLGVMSGLSLVLYSAPGDFSRDTLVFPSPKKLTFDCDFLSLQEISLQGHWKFAVFWHVARNVVIQDSGRSSRLGEFRTLDR